MVCNKTQHECLVPTLEIIILMCPLIRLTVRLSSGESALMASYIIVIVINCPLSFQAINVEWLHGPQSD